MSEFYWHIRNVFTSLNEWLLYTYQKRIHVTEWVILCTYKKRITHHGMSNFYVHIKNVFALRSEWFYWHIRHIFTSRNEGPLCTYKKVLTLRIEWLLCYRPSRNEWLLCADKKRIHITEWMTFMYISETYQYHGMSEFYVHISNIFTLRDEWSFMYI